MQLTPVAEIDTTLRTWVQDRPDAVPEAVWPRLAGAMTTAALDGSNVATAKLTDPLVRFTAVPAPQPSAVWEVYRTDHGEHEKSVAAAVNRRRGRHQLRLHLGRIAAELGNMLSTWERMNLAPTVLAEDEFPFTLALEDLVAEVFAAVDRIDQRDDPEEEAPIPDPF
jgi:hypothetical protein